MKYWKCHQQKQLTGRQSNVKLLSTDAFLSLTIWIVTEQPSPLLRSNYSKHWLQGGPGGRRKKMEKADTDQL